MASSAIDSAPDPASDRVKPDNRTKLSIAMLAPCPFPTRQGTQVVIRHLAEALARAGHEVHVITYGYGEYPDEKHTFFMHRAPPIRAGLRSGPSWRKPAADLALLMTAFRVAREQRCTFWHVHNVEGLALGALLKLWTALPLVYHAHNAMGPELPTYFRARWTRALASWVGDALDRSLPRAADAVITFDGDHKALHEVYGVAEQRLHVIPPGLDGAELRSADPSEVAQLRARIGSGPVLLYAGNPDGYQNLALMWRAFEMVRLERPDATLLVASNHPPSAFSREYRAAGRPQNVVFLQTTSLSKLRAAFRVADVGLSPRTLWTGAPIKILNYLSVGLPVVACPSGARHILTPACGRLADSTPSAFAAAVLELLAHPKGTNERRRHAFERFRIGNQVPLYEQIYEQVLGAGPLVGKTP